MNIFCPDCSQEQACVPLNENGTTWRCMTCDGIVEVSTHSIMKGDVSTGFFVDDEPRRAQTPSETPEFIGRYKVLQTLGQGGFGRVYLAEDAELNRKLAIKVVRLQGGNVEQQRASFFGEARLIARLRHPNIISVFDVGLDPDAGPYIVMELVEGRTLQQRLCDAEPLTHLQTAELVAQVANAIHYAHGQGIVHRDLKPSNILIDRQGAVRVADFGIAISEEAQINHPGDFAGTLSYMPPEQMRGETAFLDGRADIWNIGVILYQLLTGRLPFAAKDRQQIAVAIAHAPKPPR
ncbi:MAG: serine/threonine protein kinase, partial [Planctomycetia bacterium]|nr:serine/threonine protein kinase [Planctomycetia bacterium]